MQFYLMRHAQPNTSDEDSGLSPGGERQADQIAALLLKFSLPPERIAILTTKYARTRQTAERICQGLSLKPDRVVILPDNNLLPRDEFLRAFLLHHIQKHVDEGRDIILLVGHAPYFRLLFNWFLSGPDQQSPSPAYGSIAYLEGDTETSGDWAYHWMVAPLPMMIQPPTENTPESSPANRTSF